MSDIIDNGCELEQLMREQALARHQSRQRPPIGDGHCADCGSAIPLSRLHVNPYAERCIECQEVFERRGRHYSDRSHR